MTLKTTLLACLLLILTSQFTRAQKAPPTATAPASRPIGAGTGAGVSGKGGEGDALLPFGVSNSPDGAGPATTFCGLKFNTLRTVLVLDASKAVADVDGFTNRAHGLRFVDQLKPVQSFGVVYYQDGRATALAPDLARAGPESKRQAFDFIAAIEPAGGPADPAPALKLAFAAKPQDIVITSAGEWPDTPAVVKLIADLNDGRRVRVHTVALARDNPAAEKLLAQIAADNKGTFKKFDPAPAAPTPKP